MMEQTDDPWLGSTAERPGVLQLRTHQCGDQMTTTLHLHVDVCLPEIK